ncbi:MAG: hypothetical protein KTR33_01110 [Gammaproteobacteria bacterium]|nr:hypothetical protein [Gammaproteobacteria bacterium]
MNLLFKSWIVTLLTICLLISAGNAAPEKKASQTERNVVALIKLQKESNITSVYAKGACCLSCAIGIRIKISKLNFVDRKRFNKGVAINPKYELIHIAIKPDHSADIKALTKAVVDAGYDPMYAYSIADGKLVTTPLNSR